MSQPVKLSDELVLKARVAGAAMQRSIAGQVEFWASLGMEMERVMNGSQVQKVREQSVAAKMSHALESVNEPEGRARLEAYLASTPFPHFKPHPEKPRVYFREDADGTIMEGRFVGRDFVKLSEKESQEAA
jgi:hypothetical protein